MALRPEVVNFIGLDVIDEIGDLPRDGKVPIVQEEPGVWKMRVLVDVIDAVRIECACPTDEAMNLVAFLEEQFSQVASVLASDSCD